MSDEVVALSDQWEQLATVALLGTARRRVPAPPPGAAAALALARRSTDEAEQLLDQVALLGAIRRGGVRPSVRPGLLLPTPDDPRPVCSQRAAGLLADAVSEWPVLVDEWFALLEAGGRRLAPELVAPLLTRFRTDPHRRAQVLRAAGPLGDWLVELFPERFSPRARSSKSPAPAAPAAPLPADIAALAELDAPALAATLAQGLERNELGNRHRPLLVRLLCLVPPAALEPIVGALNRAGTNPATMGLALSLAQLATIRHTMIEELRP